MFHERGKVDDKKKRKTPCILVAVNCTVLIGLCTKTSKKLQELKPWYLVSMFPGKPVTRMSKDFWGKKHVITAWVWPLFVNG